eukprot:12864651-Ditylum_brightwellii.AAC.1
MVRAKSIPRRNANTNEDAFLGRRALSSNDSSLRSVQVMLAGEESSGDEQQQPRTKRKRLQKRKRQMGRKKKEKKKPCKRVSFANDAELSQILLPPQIQVFGRDSDALESVELRETQLWTLRYNCESGFALSSQEE